MTIRSIVERLQREEGFAGSYDSVRNYIRLQARDDEKVWEQAYELVVRLPKARALDFIRLLSRGTPPVFASSRIQSFLREVTCPRSPPNRPNRDRQRLADIEWMRRALQKEINDDALHREFDDMPDLHVMLKHLRSLNRAHQAPRKPYNGLQAVPAEFAALLAAPTGEPHDGAGVLSQGK